MSNQRPRNTSRQRDAGAAARRETRRLLLEAAAKEFAASGYAAATVARIADRAGVTVQTLYLAWGSKRALLRAYMETALADHSETSYPEHLSRLIEAEFRDIHVDADAVVNAIAHVHCSIAARAALGWKLYRDAAATDPEIGEDWQALQHLRRETFTTLIGRLPPRSLLPELTAAHAADTAWAIASPETYDLLVRTAGHSLDSYQDWVSRTLRAALLGRR